MKFKDWTRRRRSVVTVYNISLRSSFEASLLFLILYRLYVRIKKLFLHKLLYNMLYEKSNGV